ncbi:MAG: hypothetical protein EOO71_19130 [Myxococcaceae bacterium]|nr:MAG: hypothetical protein EOO71_19130 [Myxococcaceae bacterium]
MKHLPALLACTLLASANVSAASRGTASTFRYKPTPDDERPVVVDATIGPQGSDFAMRLKFDKLPFGEECKQRCANVTLFLDTDSSPQSGLHLATKGPENGADLAVVIQGVREYKRQDAPPVMMLRVKVRRLGTDANSTDGGELLADLNHRQDPERIQTEGTTVYLLVDATSALLPSARKVRVVYHPPGGKAVQATVPGMLGSSSGRGVQIFKHGSGNWGRAPDADPKKPRTPAAGDNG